MNCDFGHQFKDARAWSSAEFDDPDRFKFIQTSKDENTFLPCQTCNGIAPLAPSFTVRRYGNIDCEWVLICPLCATYASHDLHIITRQFNRLGNNILIHSNKYDPFKILLFSPDNEWNKYWLD